jgi:hypothetical protein
MSDTTIIYPLTLFIGTVVLWVFTALYGSRMLRAFRTRYPEIAAREIPFAFDTCRHPEKALFFFRHRAVELLRGDCVLWPMRQRFVLLSALCVCLPPLGFLPGFLFAIWRVSQQ